MARRVDCGVARRVDRGVARRVARGVARGVGPAVGDATGVRLILDGPGRDSNGSEGSWSEFTAPGGVGGEIF